MGVSGGARLDGTARAQRGLNALSGLSGTAALAVSAAKIGSPPPPEPAQVTVNRNDGLAFQAEVVSAAGATPAGKMQGTTSTGAGYPTVPDGVMPISRALLEVKGGKYIAYTKQLQAQISIGQRAGGPGNVLVVRPGATVSGPTVTAFGHRPGNPTIFTFDTSTGMFTPY
jgi:hypothetical protein